MENTGLGEMLHSVALKCGVCGNVIVGTALVVMYAKCHDMLAAQRVLEDMDEKHVATFTALVGRFALAGRPCDAMVLVREMEESGVAANMMKYSNLLSSFTSPGDLEYRWQAHCVVLKKVLEEMTKIPMFCPLS
jgi:pentatricopeptide repeat protein